MATFFRHITGLLRPLIPLAQIGTYIGQHACKVSTLNFTYVQRPAVGITAKFMPYEGSSLSCLYNQPILQKVSHLLPSGPHQPVRPLTYFGLRKGKRKTVKSVVHRFLRLHCGLWLRRKAGYKKKLWKKSAARKRRLREHVFCNKTQSRLLDKMTTSFWKRRNWFINDPYQKYHDRTNLKV
ncbi:39S ribosomal protein L35, mitochondrial [Protopterus annectens]|uniref:39S ribosomal protein L35, mitochondrial n=1 Tax=Protopterus annectens TaxID=7888 RepID=UPI001CFB908F|nr:39S ribosomal protein L35, mitochondrial [Protopterus annectens]